MERREAAVAEIIRAITATIRTWPAAAAGAAAAAAALLLQGVQW